MIKSDDFINTLSPLKKYLIESNKDYGFDDINISCRQLDIDTEKLSQIFVAYLKNAGNK